MYTNVKVIGKNLIQKQSLIDLFKNSVLIEKLKKNHTNNSLDISIEIEREYLKIKSLDESNIIKINKPVYINDLLKHINDINYNKNINKLSIQNIEIDIKKSIAIVNKKNIPLTEKEIQIIKYLYNEKNNKLNKKKLLINIWGYSDNIDTHTLESHIYKLRKKIEINPKKPKIILTDRGSYRLVL